MQKLVILMSAIAFILPVGFIMALNWEEMFPPADVDSKPQGKLIYFFTPS